MISSFDSPLLIISPVNGFFSVGVVIVFSPFCPSLVTFSVPGAKSGLNLRSFSNGISSFSTIESPFTGPYFVTLSTGGLTTSPVSGFLIPGLPGTSSFSPVGNFGSNSFLVLASLLSSHLFVLLLLLFLSLVLNPD